MITEENESLQEKPTDSKDMGFLDHLEELRWRIIFALLGIVVGLIVCFIYSDFLVNSVLLRPAITAGLKLQNLKPFGQFMIYFKVALFAGVIVSFPNIVYQLWKFVEPALGKREKSYALVIVNSTALFFVLGIMFTYYVMLPMSLKIAAVFGSPNIENTIDIEEYFDILFVMIVGVGLIFELPVLSYILSKIGLVKYTFLSKYRRHAIVVILILSAILTPGTDPVSQLILAIPLLILYEISIWVSKFAGRKKIKK